MNDAAVAVAPADALTIRFEARGAILALGTRHEDCIAIVGPAGTGKSRGVFEYVHYLLTRYPHTRALLLRRTRRSLSESGMVTYEEKVQPELDGVAWQSSKQRYAYPNGSVLAVGGLDKPGKVLSSDWDLIVIQQAEEIDEDALEKCLTRINRPGSRSSMPFNQVILDVNPDAPTHWLRQRLNAGRTVELISVHEDNPALYDLATRQWTPAGAKYMATLDALTGVRYLRYRKGIWAAAEGMVYQDVWNPALHLVSGVELGWEIGGPDQRPIPPASWPRYLSLDFGYTHPFVCGWWAMDGDGRLYRYREIYMSHRLVEDHAADIKRLHGTEPLPYAIIADPEDAEGRATFTRVTGWSTYPANKTVAMGIQAVAARLRPAGDGKPRLFFVRDSVVERDPALVTAHLPTCTEEEMEGYVWNLAAGRTSGEEPVKKDDHGNDQTRYLVAYHDLGESGAWSLPSLYG